VRQEFLRRSRLWRDQVQQAGNRFEERLEGWLEEPPWQEPEGLDQPYQSESDAPPRRRRPGPAAEEEDPWI
jgi:hypothetical protein